MSVDRLDMIIFGLTGYTGNYAARQLVKFTKERPNFKWAVAGRNKKKLQQALEIVEERTGEKYVKDIEIIIADTNDQDSLINMAKRANVLINCVGPFMKYGESVVKACIEAKTHYLDITGEAPFVNEMKKKYDDAAQKNNVLIINACGFDTIPADLGVVFAEQNFDGQINSIENYLYPDFLEKNKKGPQFNIGTWDSILAAFTLKDLISTMRMKCIKSKKLPQYTPPLKSRSLFHYNKILNLWALPFPGMDTGNVIQTQEYLFNNERKRPIQFRMYVTLGGFFRTLILAILGLITLTLTMLPFGVKLLLKYPSFFSFGYFDRDHLPNEEDNKNVIFSFNMIAEGWKEKLAEPTDQYTYPPNQRVIFKVSGIDPAYYTTSTALILAGLIVIDEKNKIPNGGVLTAGSVFSNTSLIEKLNKNCLKFEIVSKTSI